MRHVSLVSSLVVLVAAAAAAPCVSADTTTIGDFLVDVAALRHLQVSDGPSAAAALRSSGVAVPQLDLARALTEADVVAIGRALGIRLTTTRPGDRFDAPRVASFLATFRAEIGGPGNEARGKGDGGHQNDPPGPYPRPDNAADPASKGKGKKKGLESPCDPR